MIGMQDQQQIESLGDLGIDFVRFCRNGKHHVQKIGAVGEFVLGINEGLADRFFVGKGCNRSDFCHQSRSIDLQLVHRGGT